MLTFFKHLGVLGDMLQTGKAGMFKSEKDKMNHDMDLALYGRAFIFTDEFGVSHHIPLNTVLLKDDGSIESYIDPITNKVVSIYPEKEG